MKELLFFPFFFTLFSPFTLYIHWPMALWKNAIGFPHFAYTAFPTLEYADGVCRSPSVDSYDIIVDQS